MTSLKCRDRDGHSKSELYPTPRAANLNKQISYKGAYVGMTGDFKEAVSQNGTRRDMSKSTLGQPQFGAATTEMLD